MTEVPGTDPLESRARTFALELTETVRGVLGPTAPEFVAEAAPRRSGDITRVIVRTDGGAEIPISIDGNHALDLIAEFTCAWDHRGAYLAVRKSDLHVRSVDSNTTEPLFRYEFVDALSAALPTAHLHVHAHRDEMLFQLFRSSKKRSRTKADRALDPKLASPRLSGIHFPLGGTRMRPVLEDVLQMLITEFCIDTITGAEDALSEGRLRWRRRQVGALVRDAPEQAIRVLSEMGYEVRWGGTGEEPGERTDRLARP